MTYNMLINVICCRGHHTTTPRWWKLANRCTSNLLKMGLEIATSRPTNVAKIFAMFSIKMVQLRMRLGSNHQQRRGEETCASNKLKMGLQRATKSDQMHSRWRKMGRSLNHHTCRTKRGSEKERNECAI